MYAQASQQRGIKSMLTAVLEFFLSKVISRHGKRVLFITSLYFRVVQIERLRADALTKLNTLMKLAHTGEDALELPMALRGMVWNNTDLQNVLTADLLEQDISDDKVREISEKVVAVSRPWLHYGRNEMVTDVFNLIRNGGQLAAAA